MRRRLQHRSRAAERLRRARGGLAVLLALFCGWAVPALSQTPSLEYPVKATYLYKFAPFINWRSGAAPVEPFQICVAGEDPFGGVLDQAVAGQRIGQRPVLVKRVALVGRGMGCQILYLGRTRSQSVAEALRTVKGEPVLTVTDAARNPDAKGVIHFWVAGGRVRFEIDPAAAGAQGLTVSSKLMALAAKARP